MDFAETDQMADDLVAGSLGNALLDEVFHQGGRIQEPFIEPGGDPVGSKSRAIDDDDGEVEAGVHGVKSVEKRLLVLLEIAIVSQGQAP